MSNGGFEVPPVFPFVILRAPQFAADESLFVKCLLKPARREILRCVLRPHKTRQEQKRGTSLRMTTAGLIEEPPSRRDFGDGGDERLRIRMLRRAQHVLRGARFHELSRLHDGDARG